MAKRKQSEVPEDDLPPPRPAAKRPAAKKVAARRRAAALDPDDEADLMDAEGEEPAAPSFSRRMNSGDRQQAELTAALQAKLTGQPVFAYPEELKEQLRPYWVELVNAKPHDYFSPGDVPLMKLWCRVAADIDRLDREIEEEGSVVLNGRGNPIVNPRVVVRSLAETRLLSLAAKLRTQPSSRLDANTDKEQMRKKKVADAASRTLHDDDGDDDGDGLLAGSRSLN